MQDVAGLRRVMPSLRYSTEEEPLTVAASRLLMALPIIGPPLISLAAVSGMPPACSTIQERGMPIRKR